MTRAKPATQPGIHSVIAILFAGLSFVLLVTPNHTASANPGIDWLQSQQQNNGGLYTAADLATALQSHSEALRTLQAYHKLPADTQTALQFLNNEHYNGNEYLTRKIIAHWQAGQPVTTLLTTLLSHQNPDGGFGEKSRYASNVLDTALALEALAIVRHADTTATNKAINYLLSQQNNDGGWSLSTSAGTTSTSGQIYLSALTLSALFHYRHTYSLHTTIEQARTFLLQQRQSTNLWSSTFESALALIAITPTLIDRSGIASSLAALQQQQLANGSYHHDAYQTALALRALQLAAQPSPDEILLRGRVIDGETGLPLNNALIKLSGAGTHSTRSNANGLFELRKLNSGGHQLSITLTGYATLSSNIHFTTGQQQDLGDLALLKGNASDSAGLLGQITEAGSGTTLAGVSIQIIHSATGFSSSAITNTHGQYQFTGIPAGTVAIQVQSSTHENLDRLINLGTGETLIFSPALRRANVEIFGSITDRNSGAAIIGATVQVQSGRNNVSAATNSLGQYRIQGLHAEDLSITASFNNYETINVTVKTFYGSVIEFSPALVLQGETAPPLNNGRISGVVLDESNAQTLSGVNVTLSGSNNATQQTDNQGQFTFQNLAAGSTQLTLSPNGYQAQQLNLITQDFVHLNLGNINLRPDSFQPLTTVSGRVVDARNKLPLAGVSINVASGLLNTTSNTNGHFQLLASGNLNGELLLSLPDYRELRFRINVAAGDKADLKELYMRPNNAEQLLPDLRINSIDTDGLITNLKTLQISGDLQVMIENNGHAEAAADFSIQAFYDNNYDGTYTEGVDIALGKSNAASAMAAGSSLQHNVALSGTIPFRDAKLHVFLDANTNIIELNEDNNIAVSLCPCTGDQCNPTVGTLEPQLKWQWFGSGLSHMPVVGPLMDTNNDGLVNADDVPFVLGKTFTGLQAVRGDTAQTVWTFNNGQMAAGTGDTPALGDLNGDGYPEVVTYQFNKRIVAISGNGQQLWVSSEAIAISSQFHNSLSIADLDGDGQAEILAENLVLNSDGSLRWRVPVGTFVTTPLAADINLDGRQEVIMGGHVFDADGNPLWNIGQHGQPTFRGFSAVANLDDDDFAEIIIVVQPTHSLLALEHDGRLKWGPIVLPGLNGGSPVIADVDNDGEPEIGVEVFSDKFLMFEANGSLKWAQTINDPSTGASGASAFDFDNDGRIEIVFQDHTQLYLFDGATGNIRTSLPNTSLTWIEYPVIADVDADGHADIIALNGNSITAYTDANNSWQATRGIWNQHVYHIDNVTVDGGIPANPAKSWLTHNSFRMNSAPPRITSQPDLSIARLQLIEHSDVPSLQLQARIGNGGDLTSNAGTELVFYRGAPESSGDFLGSTVLPSIAAGQFIDITVSNITLPTINTLAHGDQLVAIIDPANTLAECREHNNRMSIQASGSLGNIRIQSSADSIPPQTDIHFNLSIHNPGSLAANYTVQTLITDTEGAPVANLTAATLPLLSAGNTTTLTQTWNSGTTLSGHYLARTILSDTQGTLLASEQTAFSIREDLNGATLAGLRSSTDKIQYHTTDTVHVEHLLQNLTLSALLNGLQLHTEIRTPDGTLYAHQTQTSPNLAPGGFSLIHQSFSLQAAAQGSYSLSSRLQSGGQLLAEAHSTFTVAENLSIALSAAVSAEQTELPVGAHQICHFTLRNNGTLNLGAQNVQLLLVSISENHEQQRASLTLSLPAGGQQQRLHSFNTQGLNPGNYACVLQTETNGETLNLAHALFKLTHAAINLNATLSHHSQGRLLIWLDNDTSAETPPLVEQRAFLQTLLQDNAESFTLVSKLTDFRTAFHSGAYTQYLLLAAAPLHLDWPLAKALREAVNRGEGLIVADGGKPVAQRHDLLEALGIAKSHGHNKNIPNTTEKHKPSNSGFGAHSLELLESPLHPVGTAILERDDRYALIPTDSAEIAALYRNLYHCRGDCKQHTDKPAILFNTYGQGHSVYLGFDLLAEATLEQQGGSQTLRQLLLNSIAYTRPTQPNQYHGVPQAIRLNLENNGSALQGHILLNVPENSQILDAGSAEILSPNQLRLNYALDSGASQTYTLWLIPAYSAGNALITAQIFATQNGALTERQTLHLTLPQQTLPTLSAVIAELSTLNNDKHLKKARQRLQQAHHHLSKNQRWPAYREHLFATDALRQSSHAAADPLRLAIDWHLRQLASNFPPGWQPPEDDDDSEDDDSDGEDDDD